MKDIKTITKTVIIEGTEFTLFQFTAENEHEKYFGEKPFGLVEKSLLENGNGNGKALNGFHLNVAETPERCFGMARMNILGRKFKEAHPNATDEEFVKYLISI